MFKNTQKIKALCTVAQNLCISQTKIVSERCCKYSSAYFQQSRGKKDDASVSSLFTPVPVKAKPNPDDINVGAELTGTLNKADLLKVLNKFYQQKEIKQLLTENGLDSTFNAFLRKQMLPSCFLQVTCNTRRT